MHWLRKITASKDPPDPECHRKAESENREALRRQADAMAAETRTAEAPLAHSDGVA